MALAEMKRRRGRPPQAQKKTSDPAYCRTYWREYYHTKKKTDARFRLRARLKRQYKAQSPALQIQLGPCQVCGAEAVALVWVARTEQVEACCLTHLFALEVAHEKDKPETSFQLRYLQPGLKDKDLAQEEKALAQTVLA